MLYLGCIVEYWRKPGPTDKFDWSATESNYEAGKPIGYGATKEEAIKDLIEQLDDTNDTK